MTSSSTVPNTTQYVDSTSHHHDNASAASSIEPSSSDAFSGSKSKPFFASNVMSSMGNSAVPQPAPRLSLDMEPNPFEQCFKERESSKSAPGSAGLSMQATTSSSTANPSNSNLQNSFSKPVITENSVPNNDPSIDSQKAASANASSASSSSYSNHHQFLTPGGRRILPPMSSISSPSALINNGTHASTGWSDSLRSGPLSPAMLQGPAAQQQHASANSISSSLLNLANSSAANNSNTVTSVTATSNPNANTAASASAVATASAIRPGPLSPFIQSSLLGTDTSTLFSTPGPATAAILSSLNSDLMGSTGLSPLPLKQGAAVNGNASSANAASILSSVGSSMAQVTQGLQIPALQSVDANGNATNSNSVARSSQSPSTNASSTYNGSVDAAASLYMMSKGGSQYQSHAQQPSQISHTVVNAGIKREAPEPTSLIANDIANHASTLLDPSKSLASSNLSSSNKEKGAGNMGTDNIQKNRVEHAASSPSLSVKSSTGISKSPSNTAAKSGRGNGTRNKRRKNGADEGASNKGSESVDDASSLKPTQGRGQKSDTNKRNTSRKDNNSGQKRNSSSNGEDEHSQSDASYDNHADSNSDMNANNSSNQPSKVNTSGSKSDKKKLSEDEKRKSFLERNRIAALKCRQRKKQWTQELQSKVETYATQNETLNRQVSALRDEVIALRTALLNHRTCTVGLDPELLTSLLANQPNAGAATVVGGVAQVPGLGVVQSLPNNVVQSMLSQQGVAIPNSRVGSQPMHTTISPQTQAAVNAQMQVAIQVTHPQQVATISGVAPASSTNANDGNAGGVVDNMSRSGPASDLLSQVQPVRTSGFGYQQNMYSGAPVQSNSRQIPQGNSHTLLQTSGAAR